jgi:hypothetical protein
MLKRTIAMPTAGGCSAATLGHNSALQFAVEFLTIR